MVEMDHSGFDPVVSVGQSAWSGVIPRFLRPCQTDRAPILAVVPHGQESLVCCISSIPSKRDRTSSGNDVPRWPALTRQSRFGEFFFFFLVGVETLVFGLFGFLASALFEGRFGRVISAGFAFDTGGIYGLSGVGTVSISFFTKEKQQMKSSDVFSRMRKWCISLKLRLGDCIQTIYRLQQNI